jgi:hypothetical protein
MSLKDKSILVSGPGKGDTLQAHTSMPVDYESAKLFAAQATITAGRIGRATHELAL